MPDAGPFSIERLEVSRFGSLALCVLNCCLDGCEREIGRDAAAGQPVASVPPPYFELYRS
jgi:hypothetical protein